MLTTVNDINSNILATDYAGGGGLVITKLV